MGSLGATRHCGRRLLHTTVDELAQTEPLRPWASVPLDDDDLAKGYEDITYSVLANAVNRLAWFIESSLGPANNFETFAYIGCPDLRYQMMSLAAAKTQYKALFSSHMHSPPAHLSLMENTKTLALFTAKGVVVDDILRGRPMPHFIIPDLDDMLESPPIKPYPYSKTFEEAAQDPYLILHSSGTTGMPKPIEYNHASVAALDARGNLSSVDQETKQLRRFLEHPGPSRFLVPFLHFHGICTVVMAVATVFGSATYIPGFRRRLTTKDDIFKVLDHARVDDAFLSPAMIEDIVTAPQAAAYLSKIRLLLYGGAPLHSAAALFASQHTNLQSQWGITETGKAIDYATSPTDHDYCAFDMATSGLRMQPVPGTPNLHHMFIDRTPTSHPYALIFHRDPTLTSFDTGDLWTPHPDPTKAAFTWRYAGRTDDLITYAEGSNLQPTHYELQHAEHPLVRAALLSGTGHRQPCLLLELNDPTPLASPTDTDAVLSQLWSESISPINAVAPRNGKVDRSHVLLFGAPSDGGGDPAGMTFERNVKGTVARKATLRKFEAQIEACYARYGDRGADLTGRLREQE